MQSLESKVHNYFSFLEMNDEYSGSVLIAKEGKIIINRGYGFANREHQVANTTETKYRIGSITKQFTAMAITILQEQGILKVEDNISKFIPSFPKGAQISLHELLTHSSGIPNITRLPNIKEIMRHPTTIEITVSLIMDFELEFDPGSKFQYSNSGYILLAFIIEKTTGLSFEDFLNRHIFEPLGMTNSGCDNFKEIIFNRAQGYEYDNKIVNADYVDMSFPTGGGNLYSTTGDLFKWDQSLYTEKLVTNKSLQAIFTPHGFGYGYGWFISSDNNRNRIHHGGGIVGFKNEINRYIDEGVTIIILNNLSTTNVDKISNDLASMVFQ
ncbi:CubicO group peptidase, beta-lactamase class C family [Paenibacillus sp. 1_12]|uniref:serine hydrolase domain-containing protein n=1 Tax=Paenibacillus sp. 1_12 TaxID=1566278 RepID=UPI0008EBEE27|nr:serine hydrolase domain-containing protein [Paenibacillus sp. 1_12]SFL07200.1 CubicO group peptidase, beta-lactamase class C family [Paenibacillus sp. 1_12]